MLYVVEHNFVTIIFIFFFDLLRKFVYSFKNELRQCMGTNLESLEKKSKEVRKNGKEVNDVEGCLHISNLSFDFLCLFSDIISSNRRTSRYHLLLDIDTHTMQPIYLSQHSLVHHFHVVERTHIPRRPCFMCQ